MATGTREHPLVLAQFPFSAGIDEGTRDEIVEAGAGWAVLENGRQDHRGGYSTRNGFTALATLRLDTTSPTAGYAMFADRDTVVRVTETPSAEVFSQQAASWVPVGRLPEASYTTSQLPSMGLDGFVEDVEYCNGYIIVSFRGPSPTGVGTTPADMFIAVLDATTLAPVRPVERVIAGASYPLLASYSTYVVAISGNDSATSITAYILNTASAATLQTGWVSLATVASDWSALKGISICSCSDRVAVAYVNTSGGTSQVSVKTYDSTGIKESATVNTSSVTPRAVDIACNSGDTLWVAWDETTAVKVKGLTWNSLATVLATTGTVLSLTTLARLIYISPSSTTGTARICTTDTATLPRSHFRDFVTTAGAAAATGAQASVLYAVMSGRPFRQGARHYATFFAGSISASNSTSPAVGNTQQTNIVCDWTDQVNFVRPVVNVQPGLAIQTFHGKAKAAALSTTRRVTCCHIVRSLVGYAPTLVLMDFADSRRWRPAQMGGTTFLGGGVTSYFDGKRVAEVGFLARPILPVATTSGTGITAVTGWRYACVFEELDGDGNWAVSGVSDPSASTGAVANKTVTIVTSILSISARLSVAGPSATSVRVAFYRTLDTGGTAPYYRLGTVINDPGTGVASYVDTTTDAVLATAAKLYEQPGIIGTSQDRRPPPGLSMLVSYNGMLVGAEGSNVWYSGQNVIGEASWFNPIFQTPIPGDGDITALWVMDGTLFVAKRREIYALTGEAPSDNGAAGGLGQPRRLAVDVGCIESRSPCVTAFGAVFQSDRGIEILTRAGTVEWIGESVQDTLGLYPVVTSATVDPASCTVLIECAEAETGGAVTGNGRTLIYDLSLKVWTSTDRRHSVAGVADTPSQAACMVNTGTAWRYAWLGANGRVYVENTASHLDADGTFVAKRAVSAHVKTAGYQGGQHVNRSMLLAKLHTAQDLSLSFAYDYSSSYKPARVWTYAELAAFAIPNLQVDHPMHDDTLCEAVRVQLLDVTPSSGSLGTGQGSTWIALAFETVPQSGGYLLPDASR